MVDNFTCKVKRDEVEQSWSDAVKRMGTSCGSNRFRYYTDKERNIILEEHFLNIDNFLPLTEDDNKIIENFFKNRFKKSQRNTVVKKVKVIYEDEDGEQEAIMNNYEVAKWVAFQENAARQEGYFKFIRTEDL